MSCLSPALSKRKLQNRYENRENQGKSKVKHLRNVAAKEQNWETDLVKSSFRLLFCFFIPRHELFWSWDALGSLPNSGKFEYRKELQIAYFCKAYTKEWVTFEYIWISVFSGFNCTAMPDILLKEICRKKK